MLISLIKDLEFKIDRAIEAIDDLKDKKCKLEKENESLRGQVEEFRTRVKELETALSHKPRISSLPASSPETQALKARLAKLVGRLAALEDSWN